MLDPQERVVLTESLRPPEGYALSWAIGTTYTLNLVALLSAPLAFALLDAEDEGGRVAASPPALLEALRRYADRLTIFVQAGQIAVPPPQRHLLSYLDGSIVQATAPTRGGVFHPKVWILRFAADDRPTRYRFGCFSRNLTFDRCWDTALLLEGDVEENRRALPRTGPLADFVGALPGLTVSPLAPEVRREIGRIETDLRRVRWELPEGFGGHRFWPMGIQGHRRSPFQGRRDRMLVVSPFLTADGLARLTKEGERHVLVSRLESLQELDPEVLESFEEVYVLDDAADIDAQASEEEMPDGILQGLHAKLYVADAGWNAAVWTGSMNATTAGMGPNVEFMVELKGKKPTVGIDALLRTQPGQTSLGDLLTAFVPGEQVALDEVEEALRQRIDEARLALARARLVAKAMELGDANRFRVEIVGNRRKLRLPEGVTVRCWPLMMGEGSAAAIGTNDPRAEFELAGEQLTSFFAFAVEAEQGRRKRVERFVLNLTLEGAPGDRRERVLRAILSNPDNVLRFLLFLLADGDPEQAALLLDAGEPRSREDGQESAAFLGLPLFESMLRALDRDPAKLDHVASVIAELRKAPGGEQLLPHGFEAVWDPIWEARESMR